MADESQAGGVAGEIFLVDAEGGLVAMNETPYDAEKDLQKLLEDYPRLIPGDQIDGERPRRWVLVSRERGVPSEEGGSNRWSLDHLFLDQDGIPTLVEVKRSTDTRIRREVVGQMLDYAANAVLYWPVETLRAEFEARCDERGVDPAETLANLTGDPDIDAFWSQVKTNLQAQKVRLLFVADLIPPELKRIVEFLNEQMDPAEVLAVELRRFQGRGLQTLVPRVIGQTASATQRKGSTGRSGAQWDEPMFLNALQERHGEMSRRIAEAILEWVHQHASRIFWGSGKSNGSFIPVFAGNGVKAAPFGVWTYDLVELNFQYIKDREPFVSEGARIELLQQIHDLTGADIEADRIDKRPSFPLELLQDKVVRDRFLSLMGRVAGKIVAVAGEAGAP